MQKLFNGQQSGMFAWTCRMIRSARPSIQLTIYVDGRYAPSRTKLSVSLQGAFFQEILRGYVRSLVIETPDGRHYTIGCEHAVEEDIAATSVQLIYYPDVEFTEAVRKLEPGADDSGLLDNLALAIASFDNADPTHVVALEQFCSAHGNALLSHERADVSGRFVLLLKQLNDSQACGPLLLAAVKDRRDEVREMALVDLAAYRSVIDRQAILPLLLSALTSSNQNVRAYAAEACGFYGDVQAAKALLPLLRDPEEHVREATFVALHGLMESARAEFSDVDRAVIVNACMQALERSRNGVLQAAALRLGLAVDYAKPELVARLLDGLSQPLDLTAQDSSFRSVVFYRTTLLTLLANYAKHFTTLPRIDVKVQETLHAMAEEMRALYERQREAFWCSYLRDYVVPEPKKKGQVFVNFAHALKEFADAVTDVRDQLKTAGVHLFISKDANPLTSENVFIPKIYRPIQESELMLVDISRHNLNVGYELGLAEKFNVPVVIVISKTAKDKAFDLSGHLVQFEYDPTSPDAMKTFKQELATHLQRALREVAAKRADVSA
jgi:hypothetical protein